VDIELRAFSRSPSCPATRGGGRAEQAGSVYGHAAISHEPDENRAQLFRNDVISGAGR
jgi:hypothetical protein